MSDALIISAALLSLVAIWGTIVFVIGWKHSPDQPAGSRWRRFWIVVFALTALALLVVATVRTSIPRNAAIVEATQLALQSPAVNKLLGSPIRTTGIAYGGYRGFGENSLVSAGLRLRGTNRFSMLRACGVKQQGRWKLLYAEVVAENKTAILLTPERANSCEP